MADYRIEPQPNPLTTQPRNRSMRSQGYEMPPTGPMHHRHKRHFARQEGMGFLLLLTIVGVAIYFLGWDLGFWRALGS